MSGEHAEQGKIAVKKALHEKQLLEAAFGLFLEHGVEHTTVEQITRKAGLAKGTFYLYFRDKRDTAGKVIQFWMESLLLEARDMGITPQTESGLFVESVTGLIIDALLYDSRLIGFIYHNLTFDRFAPGRTKDGGAAGVLDALAAMLEEGGVKMREPRIAVFMIMQLMAGVCYQSVLFDSRLPLAEVKPYLQTAVKGLVAYL